MKIATKSLSNIGGTKYVVSLLAVFDVCTSFVGDRKLTVTL